MSAEASGSVDVPTLADLLLETSVHHGAFEAATPKHDWWNWYAPYLHARLDGESSDEATQAADQYMKDVFHIVRR